MNYCNAGAVVAAIDDLNGTVAGMDADSDCRAPETVDDYNSVSDHNNCPDNCHHDNNDQYLDRDDADDTVAAAAVVDDAADGD